VPKQAQCVMPRKRRETTAARDVPAVQKR